MGGMGDSGRLYLFARLLAVAAGSLTLVNRAGSASWTRNTAWSASARVIQSLVSWCRRGGGVYRVGKPYQVAGRTYVPEEDPTYKAEGLASFYADNFHGRYTANGEIFDMNSITAAHPTMPLPSCAARDQSAQSPSRLSSRSTIAARGCRQPGHRFIEQDRSTAGFPRPGAREGEGRICRPAPLAGSDDRKLMATCAKAARRPKKSVMVASSKPYAPTFFDNRPMTAVPQPAERPSGSMAPNRLPSMDPEAEERLLRNRHLPRLARIAACATLRAPVPGTGGSQPSLAVSPVSGLRSNAL